VLICGMIGESNWRSCNTAYTSSIKQLITEK
jgi:hypothetical protein